MTADLPFQQNVPLAPLCSLELGGPASHFITAGDEATVTGALQWAKEKRLAVALLGGGTNLVVADEGFNGLVIRMAQKGIELEKGDGGDAVRLTTAAGESWDRVVQTAIEENLAGIECLSGIPGSAGATVFQNVGAYGQEVSETIARVRVLDRRTMQIREISSGTCRFAYRDSIFKQNPDLGVVMSVTFSLKPGGAPALRYGELERELGRARATPDLSQVREAVLTLRRSKSMILDPEDENRRSVGSFFTNPVLPAREAGEVVRRALQMGAADRENEIPLWPEGKNRVKLGAAWLIEKSGFEKGHRQGKMGLSSRHALSLVHHGGGKTDELLSFARKLRDAVQERFGVRLRPEPAFLGFEQPPL